jgi:hypothetical protein
MYHNTLKTIVQEVQEEIKTKEERTELTVKRADRCDYYFQSVP